MVTGMSVWSPFGRGVASLLDALETGRNDVWPASCIDQDESWYTAKHAREIPVCTTISSSFDERSFDFRSHQWPAWLAVETALDAVVAASRVTERYAAKRIAVCNGSSHGSNHGLIEYLRQTLGSESPDASLIEDSTAMVARTIAARLGARGPNLTFNTACSSGINALGQGARMLASGRADCVVAGAHDTFSLLSFTGFSSLQALDPAPCRPFDINRQGLTLGDGAAFVVLERAGVVRARGGRALAALTGYGYYNEGYHTTAPHPEGEGIFQAMMWALAGDPTPHQLSLVCAHGTGTQANDGAEARAVERVAQAHSPEQVVDVVSLKSQLGHSLGGAGAVQAVAAIACMNRGLRPGNIGLHEPIAHAPSIAFPASPQPVTTELALCNALGFAGSVASLAIRNLAPPGDPTDA